MRGFKGLLSLIILGFILGGDSFGRETRTEIRIPDILGFLTLKCDFHTHTVFSDGNVWPTLRVEEAWCEGLDAISITDHIEYLPHKGDIPKQHNRSYEIALPRAEELGIILIRGAEITRQMPPGHINAVFLQDVNPLDTENWRDALRAANAQGAFVSFPKPC
jgi:predicted metal-dependent phosphoesterase TrpH